MAKKFNTSFNFGANAPKRRKSKGQGRKGRTLTKAQQGAILAKKYGISNAPIPD